MSGIGHEFPLWWIVVNWWINHRHFKKDKPITALLSAQVWIFIMNETRKSIQVPRGRMEAIVVSWMLMWIDGQIRECTQEIQLAAAQNVVKEMDPDWQGLFKKVPGIKVRE